MLQLLSACYSSHSICLAGTMLSRTFLADILIAAVSCSIFQFHDDQHGTAVVAGAGLLNAVELIGENSQPCHENAGIRVVL